MNAPVPSVISRRMVPRINNAYYNHEMTYLSYGQSMIPPLRLFDYVKEREILSAFPLTAYHEETFNFMRRGMSFVKDEDIISILPVIMLGFIQKEKYDMDDYVFLDYLINFLDVEKREDESREDDYLHSLVIAQKESFISFSKQQRNAVLSFILSIKKSPYREFKEEQIHSAIKFWSTCGTRA